MRIDKDGYIGIGTQIPSKNLQVIGDEGLETGYNGELLIQLIVMQKLL